MKIFYIAYYEFLKKIRDPKFLIIMILAPIILIFILGNTLNTVLIPDDQVEVITAGYLNNDNGIVSQSFDDFLYSDSINKLLLIEQYKSLEEVQKDLEREKIDIAIYLQKGLSDSIEDGEQVNIILFGDRNVGLVNGLINSFVSDFNLNKTLNDNGSAIALDRDISSEWIKKEASNLERISFSTQERLADAIDIYSVVSMLQFLLIGSFLGLLIVKDNNQPDLRIRLKTIAIKEWQLLFAQVIGNSFFIFISGIIVILFSKYVYNAYWDGNWYIILITVLFFSIFSVLLGLLVGRISNRFTTGQGILIVLMLLFTTASGGITPESTINWLSKITPNYYAKKIIYATLYDYPLDLLLKSGLALLISILLVLSLLYLSGKVNKNGDI